MVSTSMLLFLHPTFMPRVVKMPLNGEVGGRALNSHGNYIDDHGKSYKIMELFLSFFENSDSSLTSMPPNLLG